MTYLVELSPSAQRQIRRIPANSSRLIRDALRGLTRAPRPPGCVKLRGFDNVWRIRAGGNRIIYEIFDSERRIMILRITRRNERTYRGL